MLPMPTERRGARNRAGLSLNAVYSGGEYAMTLIATDRLDLVRLFLRVAETRQISKAARELGLSQPTASRFLKRLEDLLGAKLIDRSRQGLSLTQAGQDFIAPAQRLIDGWHDAVDGARADKDPMSGTIRVSVPIAIGQSFLAVIAARFLRSHPDLAIEWHLRDDAMDVTAAGYDLWIRAGDVRREDLVVHHIYRIERAIVAMAGHCAVEHPRELQAMPAVRLTTFVPGTIALTHDSRETFQLRHRDVFTTDNLYAARTAVLEGVGYAVLPLWVLQVQLREGRLVRLCPSWRPPDITLSLAYAPSRGRSARVTALIDQIRSELQDDRGVGVEFLREAGALDSVRRLERRSRRS